MRASTLLCLVVVRLTLACADSPSISPDASAPPPEVDAATPPPAALEWSPCALDAARPDTLDAECARFRVPARWDRRESRDVELWVMRHGDHVAPRAQLWLLQGGPGASGADLGPLLGRLAALEPGLEVFTLDHRGVGESTRLGCPAQEAAESEAGATITEGEIRDCVAAVQAEWGEDLAGFSSEGAARDVAALLDATRREAIPAVVYGVSYGTTWAHRLLQIAPDAADGVALDSVNWPERTYDDYDALWDEVGRAVFDACADDETCRTRLGDDPAARAAEVYARVDEGHCPGLGSTGAVIRYLASYLLAYPETRAFSPALVHRVDRCSREDVSAILQLYRVLFPTPTGELPRFSEVLSQHIVLSELAAHGSLDAESLDARASECTFCLGVGGRPLERLAWWPTYDFPERFRGWASSDTPVLAMVGELDPFAPARRLEEAGIDEAFGGPGYVRMRGAPHGVISYARGPAGEASCGERLLIAFALDPRAALDTSCAATLPPPAFASPLASQLFGRPDLWD